MADDDDILGKAKAALDERRATERAEKDRVADRAAAAGRERDRWPRLRADVIMPGLLQLDAELRRLGLGSVEETPFSQLSPKASVQVRIEGAGTYELWAESRVEGLNLRIRLFFRKNFVPKSETEIANWDADGLNVFTVFRTTKHWAAHIVENEAR
jgi:hypothetical protein